MTGTTDVSTATGANIAIYDSLASESYIDEAPHLKHASLRRRYRDLTTEVLARLTTPVEEIHVLDLGAGECTVTLDFLERGAAVTAVDSSDRQLGHLRQRAARFGDQLAIRCGDAFDVLESEKVAASRFDLVICNSFLHHIPDYASLVGKAIELLTGDGIFFSFQDPLRFSSLGRPVRIFAGVAYASWRIMKPDALRGLGRRARRTVGIYRDDCPQDNAEYHVVRDGVNHEQLANVLRNSGMRVQVERYFSTQSPFWQRLGERFGIANTFALIAQRDPAFRRA
ncbi:MAG TPA: class I SAM-dependent methyltransferase [Gemmatimonadaceae bacterium]|nr:class I SAM-dependent methyltransferase [Gemmatimonadaceae bacterium]